MPESFRARLLGEEDAAAIGAFFRAAAWDLSATTDSARETLHMMAVENPFDPGEAPPTVGAFMGNRLVGFITSIPTRFWDGRTSRAGHWLKGYTVLEEYRNGLIAYLLLKEMLRHVGLAASLPASRPARELSIAVGMRDLGAVRDYLAPLRPARILRKLDVGRFEHLSKLSSDIGVMVKLAKVAPFSYVAGTAISLALAALRLPALISQLGLRVRLDARLPLAESLDGLWARAQLAPGCRTSRSAPYLRWRYEREPGPKYSFATAWRGAELVGLAVLAHPQRLDDSRIGGLGLGSVVDLVLDPRCPAALPAVLKQARRWAKTADYDALVLTSPHEELHRALFASGYVRIPGNIHLLIRDPLGAQGLSGNLNTWMVTRGDAWGDHL